MAKSDSSSLTGFMAHLIQAQLECLRLRCLRHTPNRESRSVNRCQAREACGDRAELKQSLSRFANSRFPFTVSPSSLTIHDSHSRLGAEPVRFSI